MKLEQTEKLFIESMYRRAVEDGQLKDVFPLESIIKLTGDASTRRYYRVYSKKNSYVICLDNPIEDSKSKFSIIQGVFSENNIRVPDIYVRSPQKGFFIQEDLGDKTLLSQLAKIDNHKDEFDIYRKVIDQLIQIHGIDENNYQDKEFTKLAFDEEKLNFEVEFTLIHFVQGLAGVDEMDSRIKGLRNNFRKICATLSSQKRVVTHRDFHSRNIMQKGAESVIIDFQDTRMGPRQYDLASLLDDCYYKIKGANVFALKKYYYDNAGCSESFEEFCDIYRLAAIQRVFKAIGSFSYIYQVRKDIRYLKYIGFGFEKLREILLECEEYSDLRKSISEIYYDY